jgi:plasmid stabilization system protein ParE
MPEADCDMDGVFDYIAYELFMPETALRYRNGIIDAINRLSVHGASLPISSSDSLKSLYGPFVRTTTYKKITIIYNVVGNKIIVRRVIAGSMIL